MAFWEPLGGLQRSGKWVSDAYLPDMGQLDHHVVFGTKSGAIQDFQRSKKYPIGVKQTPLDPPRPPKTPQNTLKTPPNTLKNPLNPIIDPHHNRLNPSSHLIIPKPPPTPTKEMSHPKWV